MVEETLNILLSGAPDFNIGAQETKSNGLQVMHIDLTEDVLDELMTCAESGKQPQILFGRAPQLRYGDKTQLLETAAERLRNELYLADNDENFTFAGLISHSLAVQEAQDNTSGVDTALEALKTSLATIQEAKEARKTVIDSSPLQPQHRRNLSKRDNLLKPSHLGTPGRSLPPSPALGSSSSPRVGPTSAPAQEDLAKLKAIRYPTLHLLAVKPRSLSQLTRLLRCKPEEAKSVLTKIAKPDSQSIYTLSERAYKELDVFGFPYRTSEERKSAIDNAIRAYDRQRLSTDDKLWQKLLPKEERGKGTILSKLHLRPPTQAVATGTKAPRKTEKKESTKKVDSEKKEVKEGLALTNKKTVTKKPAMEEGPKLPTKTVTKEPAKSIKKASQEQVVRRKKAPKSAALVPKEDRENDVPSSKTTSQKVTKPTTAKKAVASASKTLNSKPKNPSPLSASPPVNASDFDSNHPVHEILSASTSPAKTSSLSSMSASNSDRSLKRKANDLDNNIHSHSTSTSRPKQRRIESDSYSQSRTPKNGFKPGSRTATPSSGPSSNSTKRKVATIESDSPAAASTRTPTKRPRLSANTQPSNTQPSTSSESLSDSSPASPLPLSYRQTIELSQRFSTYYEKYHKLHNQLSTSPEPPTTAQRDELLRMHNALSNMKEEIRVGAAKPRVST